MIVVTGRVQIPAEQRERFHRRSRPRCARASRGDDGCTGYRVYEDLEQPGRYVFIEEWRDDEALQAHFAPAPHDEVHGRARGDPRRAARRALSTPSQSTRRLDPARGLVARD